MKILAFIENQWDCPEANTLFLQEHPKAWHASVYLQIFGNSKTRLPLFENFGVDLCNQIIWELITRQITAWPQADEGHMRGAIESEKPDVLLAFGERAKKAIRKIEPSGLVIFAPHPAARGPTTIPMLQLVANDLRKIISTQSASVPLGSGTMA